MKRLIVNADDFGLTVKVNEAIVKGHCQGVITSTSLLANGEAFESAVALAGQAVRLGVGVHLNLTEGRPILPISDVPTLVNARGLFARTVGRLWRAIVTGQVSTGDVEREWRAQIEKVLAAGIAPTHLDSHKHVHAWPTLAKLTIRLARAFGIPAIRCPVEYKSFFGRLLRQRPGSIPTVSRQLFSSFVLAVVCRGWRHRLQREGISHGSYFHGLTPTGFLGEDILREILLHLPDGTSELMCHPGFVDDALRRTRTRLLEQREVEYEVLTQPAIKRLAKDLGIQLVSYRDVASCAAP
jgi:hopanoid biosynthesis associated protein HpnK